MKKSKYIILICLIILIVAIVTIMLIVRKNEKYIDKSITMEDLQNIDNNIKEGKLITIDEFKQYELKDEELENGQKKYIYNMNDKYQVEVIERNQRIVSVILKNKVTYTSVDIMYSSLTRFLETE
ncbi:MAG: hypothetical protein ACI4ON_01635 [Clostridia bacterium]